MSALRPSRREFFQSTAAGALLGAATPLLAAAPEKPRSPNARLGIGAIGLRYQGTVITLVAQQYGDVVALCDVDRNVLEQARASFGSTPKIYDEYEKLLADKRVDVVLIGTPDHWHAKMVVDACRAGKDVYVEKPLTLTVDEGKLIERVARETGRVVQVGSWQRSDSRFRLAVEMVRQGRIGQLQRVDVVLGKNFTGGPFERRPVPGKLNWDRWRGQTPDVPYREERCHYTFRWWYEYSGGQMTDWGAHHIDIAQWAIGDVPVEIATTATMPTVTDGYNVAVDFAANYRFGNGVEMTVADHGRNGILFTGSEGRMIVNRNTIEGKPVDALKDRPLKRAQFTVYGNDNLSRPERAGKLDAIINHMGNFFDCVQSRKQPISNIADSHRTISTCHLGNISMRLGRPLKWDPAKEQFIDDSEANTWLRREQRKGYEVV
ncbi:MAG TPA: Gfo/Idh/MocA family oxidoreductase [Pirellulales bacterium]|jgi:predicted dehydrogenase|nr:Gfo/Idh/MocA family oxidoreductase [Pirellulales bacterium]